MINILFVCVGNTCRSAMCEYLFKYMLKQKNLSDKFNVKSCGIYATNNSPATKNTIELIKNFNSEIKNHKASNISKQLVSEANYIFTLDNLILKYVKNAFKQNIFGKIKCINQNGISDPFGSSLNVYKQCLSEIEKSLDIILDDIIKNEKL